MECIARYARAFAELHLREIGHSPAFAGLMAAYHQALEGKGPLPVTLSDARRPLGLVAVLYHSADLGCDLAPPITLGHPESDDRRPERLKHSAAPPAMAGG